MEGGNNLLSTLVNGFTAVLSLFTSAWNLLTSFLRSCANLFLQLPSIIDCISSLIDYMPYVVSAAAAFCLTVRILVLTIHKKAGE